MLTYSVRRAICFAVPLSITVAGALRAQPVSRDQLLDYMEQIRNDNDLPGLSVAVAVDGETAARYGEAIARMFLP